MDLQEAVEQAISQTSGHPFGPSRREWSGGGCINEAWRLDDGARRFFVKVNRAERADMFAAEAAALEELAAAGALRVPRPLVHGRHGGGAFLVLEHLDLTSRASEAGHRRLGEGLAALHRHTAEAHGWGRDNYIGSTPQPNDRHPEWPTFFCEQRLRHQLRLAAGRGGNALAEPGERLAEGIGALFTNYRPAPSLLHGDLWGGNAAFLAGDEPVVYDPATYYGDRETDLAMTELFGGFHPVFYDAYRAAWPLDPGYAVRRDLYQLYHILNHYVLFGGGYLRQARGLMERLLVELGGRPR